MNFFEYFYKYELFRTDKTQETDELGDTVEKYIKTISFKADLQPVNAKTVIETWGEDIQVDYNLYCAENFNNGDILIYNSETYKVIDKKDWSSTNKIYALRKVDAV